MKIVYYMENTDGIEQKNLILKNIENQIKANINVKTEIIFINQSEGELLETINAENIIVPVTIPTENMPVSPTESSEEITVLRTGRPGRPKNLERVNYEQQTLEQLKTVALNQTDLMRKVSYVQRRRIAKYIEGKTLLEIAREENVTEQAVRTGLIRAMEYIRRTSLTA